MKSKLSNSEENAIFEKFEETNWNHIVMKFSETILIFLV
jgi:hypothetical protein